LRHHDLRIVTFSQAHLQIQAKVNPAEVRFQFGQKRVLPPRKVAK
jgi:hypothetical protein